MEMLQRVFPEEEVRLRVHDISEDPFEQAFWLFVPEKVRHFV
jgi:hypothetical protein